MQLKYEFGDLITELRRTGPAFVEIKVSIIDGVSSHHVSCEDRIPKKGGETKTNFHLMAPFTEALFTPAGSWEANSRERGVWNPAHLRPLAHTANSLFPHIFCSQLSPQMSISSRWPVAILMRAVSHWQYDSKTKTERLEAVRSTSGGREHKKRTKLRREVLKLSWLQTVDLSSSRSGERAPTPPPPVTMRGVAQQSKTPVGGGGLLKPQIREKKGGNKINAVNYSATRLWCVWWSLWEKWATDILGRLQMQRAHSHACSPPHIYTENLSLGKCFFFLPFFFFFSAASATF